MLVLLAWTVRGRIDQRFAGWARDKALPPLLGKDDMDHEELRIQTFTENFPHLEASDFHQCRLTLRFKHPDVEQMYLVHRYHTFVPSLRLMAKAFWAWTLLCTLAVAFDWTEFPLYHFIRGPQGTNVPKDVSMYLPLLVLTAIACALHSRLLTPNTYQTVLLISTIGFVYVWTDLLDKDRQALAAFLGLPSPNQAEIYSEHLAACLAAADTAMSSLADMQANLQDVAMNAAWSTTGESLFLIGVSCTLGFEPLPAAVSMASTTFFLHSRSTRRARFCYGVDLPSALALHAVSSAVLVFSCYVATSLMRRDFKSAVLVTAMKNRRIEQVQREKERLDYERNMLLHTVTRFQKSPGDSSGPSGEEEAPRPNGGEGAPAMPAMGGLGAAREDCLSVLSAGAASFVSSAAEELGAMARQEAAGHQLPVAQQLRIGLLPLYNLLPQYYDEAEYAPYPSAEELKVLRGQAWQLRVDSAGRLVHSCGTRLVAGAHAKPKLGIFVMDREGHLLLTFDWASTYQQRHSAQGSRGAAPATRSSNKGSGGPSQRPPQSYHHSSMMAGAPVSAAGQMKIQDGRLLSLNNESGHYCPPASCLRTVLSRLREMGVASLESVTLECTHSPLTQTAAGAATYAGAPTHGPSRADEPQRPTQPTARRAARSPARRSSPTGA